MNVRQQKYKLNRIKGMSAYRAAIEAGYAHATAINAHRNIEKRCNFDELMIRHGLDDAFLLGVLKQGLSVTGMTGHPTLTTKAYLEIALKLKGRLSEREQAKIAVNINNYPNRTFIFTDIDDSDTRNSSTTDIHASSGTQSRLEEEQV